MRAVRLARHITAWLDAQTPGVRTTRLLRPRTSPPASPTAGVRSPSGPNGDAVSAVSYRACGCSRDFPPCSLPCAPTPSRPPHPGPRPVTVAKRPLWRAGTARVVRQNRISVNTNILTNSYRPSAGVFCPSGDARGRGS